MSLLEDLRFIVALRLLGKNAGKQIAKILNPGCLVITFGGNENSRVVTVFRPTSKGEMSNLYQAALGPGGMATPGEHLFVNDVKMNVTFRASETFPKARAGSSLASG